MMTTERTEVLIVGMGPVGAILAGLLGRRGRQVIVIDRDLDVFALPRAAHIDHTALRSIQELGIVDQLMDNMIPNPGLDFVNRDRKLLMQIPGSQGSVSGLPASMYFHQPGFDRTVRQAVTAMKTVDVRLGTEFVGLEQFDDHVSVAVQSPDGPGHLCADWVVACDGAVSPVRELLGLRLESLGFDEQWLVVDLVLEHEVPSLPDHAVHVCDPRRPHTAIPMPNNRYRFELMLLPDDDPLAIQTPDSIASLLSGYLAPGDARLERGAVYTFHGLVGEKWRDRRVLLAGDAAHQMPPFLGQGMCSGVRDATNLSWKLDAVIRRQAPETLLDTYQSERAPHVRAVVQAAVDFGRIICTLDEREAELRDRRFLDGSQDSREVSKAFGLPRLLQGPLVRSGGGGLFPQPNVGAGEERLDDVIGQRFLVLARDQADLANDRRWWEQYGALVVTVSELEDRSGTLLGWLERHGASVVIVRPDRYVLGAGDSLSAITAEVAGWLDRDSVGEPVA